MSSTRNQLVRRVAINATFFIFFSLAMTAEAYAHAWSWRGFSYGDNTNTTVEAPNIQGASRVITFVDGIQYWPAHDDDFNYAVFPTDNTHYSVTTAGGNASSSVSFRLSTWDLPGYVGWERRYIKVSGNRDMDATVFNVPDGQNAVVITEVLAYWPGGDDDLAYAVRATGLGNAISVTAICDFGRNNASSVTIRATLLYWPADAPASVLVNRIIGTQAVSQYWDAPCDERAILITPTAYMTDVSKYGYESFDNLAAKMLGPSTAGKSFSSWGTVEDAGKLSGSGITAISGNPIAIGGFAFEFGKQLKKYIGLAGPDQRDDDFYFRTRVDKCRATADIGDGNSYSLGEATVWAIDFGQ